MNVVERSLTSIRPYEANPRLNDQAVDAVAASIHEFGFRQPIVVDEDGVIIAGHTRYKAALKLGLEHVPVHVAAGLTPAQVKAYRLADNQTATLAQWDDDLLTAELMALAQTDIDLSVTGFSEEDLARFLDVPTSGDCDPDAVPEPPEAATTQPGDLWILGRHRLLCGDSAKTEDVDRLLDGAAVHLVNTDPPYGVKVEPRSNNAIAAGLSSFGNGPASKRRAGRGKVRTPHQQFDVSRQPGKAKATTKKLRAKDRPLANDFVSEEKFNELLHAWFGQIARVLLPGRSFYLYGGYSNCGNYPSVLKAHDLYFAQAIVWVKEHPVLTRKDYMGNFELAFYGWKLGAGHKFFGPANATDVWNIKKVNPQNMVHLTEKPVELARRAIENSSRPGEHVLDLFGGSGSTLIAAEQTRRRAFLMELDPLYCDTIVQRWQNFAGKTARRVSAPVTLAA